MSSQSYSGADPAALAHDPANDADLDLLAGLLGQAPATIDNRSRAACLLKAFGGLAAAAAADQTVLRGLGLSTAAVANLERARELAVALARSEACRRRSCRPGPR